MKKSRLNSSNQKINMIICWTVATIPEIDGGTRVASNWPIATSCFTSQLNKFLLLSKCF